MLLYVYYSCVLDPGDKIVDCPPTFTMYEFDAAVNGALVIKGKNNITKRQLSKCIKKKIDHFIHVESETDICKTD